MDDRSWIYRDLSQWLWRMNCCNGVQGFINYTLSNSINISGGGIRCPCKRCKNKKFIDPDVVTMHLLQKRLIEKYMCWYVYGEPYVVERMVESTFSSSNVHEVVDDNSNPYTNMIMDVMRINQGHASQCPIINEEPNTDTLKFFDLL